MTLSYFKPLVSSENIVHPYYYFASSILLGFWFRMQGLGPLTSVDNDGNKPFGLTNATRVALLKKDIKNGNGQFEVMLKKAGTKEKDDILKEEVELSNGKYSKVEDIPHVNVYMMLRAIEGGLFLHFFEYIRQTTPFRLMMNDPNVNETNITWEGLLFQYTRCSSFELGM